MGEGARATNYDYTKGKLDALVDDTLACRSELLSAHTTLAVEGESSLERRLEHHGRHGWFVIVRGSVHLVHDTSGETAHCAGRSTVDDREIVDISDVNPVQSVLSGVAALATAYVFWLVVSWAAGSFDKHPIDSDIYAIQRISTVMRTVVLGSGTLLTGITAFAGVGLLALGGKVALGGGDDGE